MPMDWWERRTRLRSRFPPGPQSIDLLTPLPAVLNPLIVDVAATQNVVIDASAVGDSE